ncbi:hypothetical protein [Sphingobium ummariense]
MPYVGYGLGRDREELDDLRDWDERVRMMQYWSDQLDEMRDGARVLKPNFRRA